jgi:ferredoxin
MTHKIVIDEEACIGCGSCAEICPSNFIMKGEKAKVKKDKVEKISCEKDAEAACPVDAISIS